MGAPKQNNSGIEAINTDQLKGCSMGIIYFNQLFFLLLNQRIFSLKSWKEANRLKIPNKKKSVIKESYKENKSIDKRKQTR